MLKIGNLTNIGQTHVVCATDGWGETNVPHLQWHGRRSEIIPHNDRGITKQCIHMARFGGEIPVRVCSKKRKSSAAAE